MLGPSWGERCDSEEIVWGDMTEKRLELVRGLGAWASAAIVVGTMIGTGIFLKPAEMAREGRGVSVVFAAWIVGAIHLAHASFAEDVSNLVGAEASAGGKRHVGGSLEVFQRRRLPGAF